MVASGSDGLYAPFPPSYSIEDGAQSSEEGSGLHSPTFLDRENPDIHRGDFPLRASDLDVPNVSAVMHLAAINTVPAFTVSPFHHPHDISSQFPYQRDYEEDHDHYYHRQPRGNHFSPSLHASIRSPAHHSINPPRPLLTLPSLPAGISDQRVYLSTAGEPVRVNEDTAPGDDYDSASPMSPPEGGSVSASSSKQSQGANRSTPARREASLVVIACQQCRARKIRCDSTRPSCNNCIRRSNECHYDPVPKRRGPDKRPGTRQRSCKKRPADGSLPLKKKQKRSDDHTNGGDPIGLASTSAKDNLALRLDVNFTGRNADSHPHSAVYTGTPIDEIGARPFHFPSASASPMATHAIHAPGQRSVNSPELKSHRPGPFSLYENNNHGPISAPSMDRKPFPRPIDLNRQDESLYLSPMSPLSINRKTWWEELLREYSQSPEESAKDIENDLAFLFRTSNYWLSFINEGLFFRTLRLDLERDSMQPALVLAMLALATLMKSSEIGHGQAGRDRALCLRDKAQDYLVTSWHTQDVDSTLAEAAMVIAIFENSAHPQHSADRACAALLFLDEIIRSLALTTIDANDPAATVFAHHAVPMVARPPMHDINAGKRCFCSTVQSPTLTREHVSSGWSGAPEWDPSLSIPEVRKEESRRLCWSALTLAAAHTAHCAAFGREPLDLFLIQPENYALLFPGEKGNSLDRHSLQSPKQSVWALYCRSMLLWNGCLRLRKGSASDEDKAEFAMQAWQETQEIQDTIDSHICAVDTQLLYMTREYLFNARVAITFEFRRNSSPMFSRKHAEEWCYYQSQTAKRFQSDLHSSRDPQTHVLARRPFYVWWFMSQVAISLSLYSSEGLIQALELCKAFLVPLDILSALWPCAAQRDRYIELRDELAKNCLKAGISPPPPPNFSVPPTLHHL